MSDTNTRDRLETLQIICLVLCGVGTLMFSPPNKMEMTPTGRAGLGLIGICTLIYVTSTIDRLARWLNAKSKFSSSKCVAEVAKTAG